MANPKIEPYGTWKSPITSQFVTEKSVRFSDLWIDQNTIYWDECRPNEAGRYCVVRYTNGKKDDVIPQGYNARTRVHEYGGASFGVENDVVYFTNFKDQAIYKSEQNTVKKITYNAKARYADFCIDPTRSAIYCVREIHDSNVQNSIALVRVNGEEVCLAEGYDFYSSPQLSSDGKWLAYVCWNHPNMPWDHTELWLHGVNSDGTLQPGIQVCKDVSVIQPKWSPDNRLHFISDQTGFWNIYRYVDGKIENLYEKNVEFGDPPWVFGNSNYVFYEDRIVCFCFDGEKDTLNFLQDGVLTPIELPYQTLQNLEVVDQGVVFIGGAFDRPEEIVYLDCHHQKTQVLAKSRETQIDKAYLSKPELICFPGYQDQPTYAFYYPPQNKDFIGSNMEKPPLIVKSHGGPTSHVVSSLNFGIQYWTSRGFAFVDVNYGGSTGYGREYRERLKGKWGIVDIEDCTKAALYLAEKGLADKNRLIIKGGSAGGYTTLAALTFTDVFKAGASYYGVSDLEALVKDTHKFESRYLDGLVGNYPEKKSVYDSRSPIYHTNQLSGAIILLQGDEDKIVPPSQAQKMFDVLKKKGLPTSYVLFQGEQHGFRKAENIQKALESEYYFYAKVFDFKPAEKLPEIPIENLP